MRRRRAALVRRRGRRRPGAVRLQGLSRRPARGRRRHRQLVAAAHGEDPAADPPGSCRHPPKGDPPCPKSPSIPPTSTSPRPRWRPSSSTPRSTRMRRATR
ncbi:hypothetical protein EF908_37300 [Streptomyces sp. WAC04770]|nr:hypothetical protein EF908_37300 [Streptomyces sp. WAC04770]